MSLKYTFLYPLDGSIIVLFAVRVGVSEAWLSRFACACCLVSKAIRRADNKAGVHKGQLSPVQKHNLIFLRPDTTIVILHVYNEEKNSKFNFIVDQLLHVDGIQSVCIPPFKCSGMSQTVTPRLTGR